MKKSTKTVGIAIFAIVFLSGSAIFATGFTNACPYNTGSTQRSGNSTAYTSRAQDNCPWYKTWFGYHNEGCPWDNSTNCNNTDWNNGNGNCCR